MDEALKYDHFDLITRICWKRQSTASDIHGTFKRLRTVIEQDSIYMGTGFCVSAVQYSALMLEDMGSLRHWLEI